MKIIVKVKPAARENSIIKKGEEFILSTTEHTHGGRANEAVCRLVADHFGVSARRVLIIQGRTSRRKIVEIA